MASTESILHRLSALAILGYAPYSATSEVWRHPSGRWELQAPRMALWSRHFKMPSFAHSTLFRADMPSNAYPSQYEQFSF